MNSTTKCYTLFESFNLLRRHAFKSRKFQSKSSSSPLSIVPYILTKGRDSFGTSSIYIFNFTKMYMHFGDNQNTRVGVTIIETILMRCNILSICLSQQTVSTKHPAAVEKDFAFNPCSSPTQQICHV